MQPNDVDFSKIPLEDNLANKLAEEINSGVVIPPLNHKEALDALKELLFIQRERQLLGERIQNEKELQDENIKQRNKLIKFFVWLISAQFVSVFVIVILCIILMSLDLLLQYEYDWVLSVLRAYFIVISLEVLSLFGVVVFRFFGSKKDKSK